MICESLFTCSYRSQTQNLSPWRYPIPALHHGQWIYYSSSSSYEFVQVAINALLEFYAVSAASFIIWFNTEYRATSGKTKGQGNLLRTAWSHLLFYLSPMKKMLLLTFNLISQTRGILKACMNGTRDAAFTTQPAM